MAPAGGGSRGRQRVDTPVETPSGKTAKDENFPVGSWLLAPAMRPHVAAFYAFARAADDIADNGSLAPAERIARLDAMAAALESGTGDPVAFAKAHRLRDSLRDSRVPVRHALDLLDAFRQDAVKTRYATWAELIDYCDRSAAPVGRFLLDLHGESRGLWPATDALCNALQILNHLQDGAADLRTLDRAYLPLDWLTAAGGSLTDLTRPAATPALRACIDRCLDGVDALLDQARPFPRRLASRRLAAESAVVLALALRLARRLRTGDPVATRVRLTRWDVVTCGAGGLLRALIAGQGAGPAARSAAEER